MNFNEQWNNGVYTHDDVEAAIKAKVSELETAISEGGTDLQSLRSDVQNLKTQINNLPSWAKQSTKPSYNANEIGGVGGYANLLAKLNAMDEAIADAAASGGEVDLSDYYTKTQVDNLLGTKANDNEVVKSITVNGQTQTPTPTNGNVNITVSGEQADWNQSNPSSPAFIKNKPTIPASLSELSGDTTHRVVTDAEKEVWNDKQDALTFDQAPTDGSQSPVTSDGVYNAIEDKLSQVTVNAIPAESIAVEDNFNSTSATNALSANKGRELKNIVGSPITYNETILNETIAPSESVKLYDVELHAGDKLKLVYTSTIVDSRYANSLAIVTVNNDTNVDSFVNSNDAPITGTIEITLTGDANHIKVYNQYQPVAVLITSERINPLSNIVGNISDDVEEHTESINELKETIGEPVTYNETILDRTKAAGGVVEYSAALHAGDKLRLVYSMVSTGNYNSLSVCTSSNHISLDYFVNSDNAALTGDIEITLTEDADAIKVYNPNNSVKLLITSSRISSLTDVTNIAMSLQNRVSALEEGAGGGLGSSFVDAEAILGVNNGFNGNEFMGIVMLDNNYKYFSVANIKQIIDAMHAVGLNYLELGFGGSGRGLGFELDDMTFISADGIQYDISEDLLTSSGKYLSETDMTEIIGYAANNGVSIMPSFNVLSHMDALLRNRQELCYPGTTGDLDFNNPTAVNFALGVAEMYARWFAYHGSKHYNLCADEFSTAGGQNFYITLQARGEYGYATFINRLTKLLGQYRYTVHCWNDALCVNGVNYPFINRNLVVSFWDWYSGWATPEELLAEGHQLINASYDIYWVANPTDPQVTEAKIRSFNIKKFRRRTNALQNIPRGAKFCIWIGKRENPALDDDGAAITTEVLPLITAFGETISSQISQ